MIEEGPLTGLKVVEFVGLGPAPFVNMALADLGAEIFSVVRPGIKRPAMTRNRTLVEADLKSAAVRDEILSRLDEADVLIESYRPGVMERLGLGPGDICPERPRLIYARLTGWGQH